MNSNFQEFIKEFIHQKIREYLAKQEKQAERAAASVITGEVKGAPEFEDTKGQQCCGCCGQDKKITPGACGGLCAPAATMPKGWIIEDEPVADNRSIFRKTINDLLERRLIDIKARRNYCVVDGETQLVARFLYGWDCRKVEVERIQKEIAMLKI